jgi:hypothetical protein
VVKTSSFPQKIAQKRKKSFFPRENQEVSGIILDQPLLLPLSRPIY